MSAVLHGASRGTGTAGPVRMSPPEAPAAGHIADSGQAGSVGSRLAAAGCTHYVGRSSGSGQCVALVHAVSPAAGPTSHWVRGEPVKGNNGIRPGTAIATFGASGRYENATDGSSHAAIYLGQNGQGIQVLDQWAGSPAAVRTIRWSNPGGKAADTGNAFHVVRTA